MPPTEKAHDVDWPPVAITPPSVRACGRRLSLAYDLNVFVIQASQQDHDARYALRINFVRLVEKALDEWERFVEATCRFTKRGREDLFSLYDATSCMETCLIALSRAASLIPVIGLEPSNGQDVDVGRNGLDNIISVLGSVRNAMATLDDQLASGRPRDDEPHLRLFRNEISVGLYSVPYRFLADALEQFYRLAAELIATPAQ
jgi:hypothetical protein